ncbi:unnamed protein product [Vitrella brassicaformis CCMP3155]|uniref:Uncharacterized protein n=4 Tax=Vitrella brassicaformis TaxID=1169539 RepID=A0A0G4G0E1_VITBC|nr:unnamed protein product [Vitrella brassicaformis CCMP3155]|eukprot:CEM21223.1 unnamed protein product [Vitrella brassicaformis CCMP3155]
MDIRPSGFPPPDSALFPHTAPDFDPFFQPCHGASSGMYSSSLRPYGGGDVDMMGVMGDSSGIFGGLGMDPHTGIPPPLPDLDENPPYFQPDHELDDTAFKAIDALQPDPSRPSGGGSNHLIWDTHSKAFYVTKATPTNTTERISGPFQPIDSSPYQLESALLNACAAREEIYAKLANANGSSSGDGGSSSTPVDGHPSASGSGGGGTGAAVGVAVGSGLSKQPTRPPEHQQPSSQTNHTTANKMRTTQKGMGAVERGKGQGEGGGQGKCEAGGGDEDCMLLEHMSRITASKKATTTPATTSTTIKGSKTTKRKEKSSQPCPNSGYLSSDSEDDRRPRPKKHRTATSKPTPTLIPPPPPPALTPKSQHNKDGKRHVVIDLEQPDASNAAAETRPETPQAAMAEPPSHPPSKTPAAAGGEGETNAGLSLRVCVSSSTGSFELVRMTQDGTTDGPNAFVIPEEVLNDPSRFSLAVNSARGLLLAAKRTGDGMTATHTTTEQKQQKQPEQPQEGDGEGAGGNGEGGEGEGEGEGGTTRVPEKTNTTVEKMTGVKYDGKCGQEAWVATMKSKKGKPKEQRFLVSEHGYNEAYNKAKDTRLAWEAAKSAPAPAVSSVSGHAHRGRQQYPPHPLQHITGGSPEHYGISSNASES